MKQGRTTPILVGCVLLCCCTSTESAIAPLGFGPLASAERAEREHVPPRSPSSTRSKRTAPTLSKNSTSPVASAAASVAAIGGASSNTDAGSLRNATTAESNSPRSTTADWLGLWHGKDATRFQLPSFPSEPMTDDNARIRVEVGEGQEIKLVLIDSSNESDLCSLSAQVQNQDAQITPGQPCFGNEDESVDLDVEVRSGSAKLDHGKLIVQLFLDAEIKSEQLQARGSIDYHFEGTH